MGTIIETNMALKGKFGAVKYAIQIKDTEQLAQLFHDVRKSNKTYRQMPAQCFIETSLPAQDIVRSKWSALGHTEFLTPLQVHLRFKQLHGGCPQTVLGIIQIFEDTWNAKPVEECNL